MAPKKKSGKPLNKKAMKKTKGGTAGGANFLLGDGSVRNLRYAGKFADPPDPDLNSNAAGQTL